MSCVSMRVDWDRKDFRETPYTNEESIKGNRKLLHCTSRQSLKFLNDASLVVSFSVSKNNGVEVNKRNELDSSPNSCKSVTH